MARHQSWPSHPQILGQEDLCPSHKHPQSLVGSDSWSAIAAIGGAISAIAAFAALCFSANQNSQTAAALSLSSAQKFSDECRDLWRRCRSASNDHIAFNECIGEILGSFELFSIPVNDGTLTPRVREYILETICDYLNGMVESGYSNYVQPHVEDSHVCKELKSLAIQNRNRLKNPSGVADMLNIPRSSLS